MQNDRKDKPVGYGHPPVATRFKPGQSGNPRGRPKKMRTLSDEICDELNEITRFHENGVEVELPNGRAIVKTLVRNAIAGNMRASGILVSACARISRDNDDDPQDQLAAADDIDILENLVDRELRRRESDASVDNSQTKSREDRSEDNEQ